jgi:acetolactate synthase I/III small subunit
MVIVTNPGLFYLVLERTVKQTIQLWVEDRPGVLMRVAGIITAKGLNIESLTVIPAEHRTARILIVTETEAHLKTRIVNEMNRLVQVLEAADVSPEVAADLPPVGVG